MQETFDEFKEMCEQNGLRVEIYADVANPEELDDMNLPLYLKVYKGEEEVFDCYLVDSNEYGGYGFSDDRAWSAKEFLEGKGLDFSGE